MHCFKVTIVESYEAANRRPLRFSDRHSLLLRNSYKPARWLKQIKRTVSFDVTTRFNRIPQSTAIYNSHTFSGRKNDQLKHSKYIVVLLLSLRKAVLLHSSHVQ